MNKKIIFMIAMLVVFSLTIFGCTQGGGEGTSNDTDQLNADIEELEEVNDKLIEDNQELQLEIEALKEENKELAEQASSLGPDPNMSLLQTSLQVLELVKNKEMADLSTYVHPNKGLRFTPYFYVDIQNDQVFNPQQVANLDQDTSIYHWGNFDGSGDPIDLDFNDYYDIFVYDEEYINPHIIGNNTAIGSGNIIDNVGTEYPNGEFVEFHFTGFDPQYTGMDWSSLRLVFEQHAGAWHLVGIVNGQWTI